MKNLKKTLNTPIPGTHFRLWHVLAGLSLLWIVPAFLPLDTLFNGNGYTIWLFILAWAVTYRFVSYLMKNILRSSATDIILIERIMILMSFLIPAVQGLLYGAAYGFTTLLIVFNGVTWVICLLLIIGIVIHIKKADDYYHGVKKDELFQ